MIRQLVNNIYYVGVNDRQKDLFENMLPLQYGVSYNSYLINDEKTVLVDTVEHPFVEQLINQVTSVLNGKPLDYLIVNHMEPDHSSGIKTLKLLYPDLQIILNAKTADMLNGYYGISDNLYIVKDGDTFSTGSKTLSFHFTPMVHWPEVMMTYVKEDELLFSADAFGCFGALNGAVIDSELDLTVHYNEMVRYYANIVGKYGLPVQNALKKLSGTPIKMICSLHGPVWKDEIAKVVGIYDTLSKYEAEPGVVIVYGSMYGHTEQMAEAVAEGAASITKNVKVYDVSRTNASYILADIFRYKGFICGSPTYCNELYPEINSLLAKIKTRGIKNREFGCFGSFTWAGATLKNFKAFAEEMKWDCVATPEIKQNMTEEQYKELYNLGRVIAEKTI
ncbi:MAG: FprA family A-type flavoprotein [Paludibacteraceae bacterium]|nr:FprA family A-type flavoprotein [Paludibacteraceae bacterium]